jgi:hypothetical protein
MHVHVSFLSFLITIAYMVVGKFFLSYFSMRYGDTALGEGVAFVS